MENFDPNVRRVALVGLGPLDSPGYIERLARFLEGSDAGIRAGGANFVCRLSFGHALPRVSSRKRSTSRPTSTCIHVFEAHTMGQRGDYAKHDCFIENMMGHALLLAPADRSDLALRRADGF